MIWYGEIRLGLSIYGMERAERPVWIGAVGFGQLRSGVVRNGPIGTG